MITIKSHILRSFSLQHQSWVRNYRRVVDEPTRNYLTQLAALLHPSSHLTSDPRLYSTAVNRFAGLWPYWLDTVCRIGYVFQS